MEKVTTLRINWEKAESEQDLYALPNSELLPITHLQRRIIRNFRFCTCVWVYAENYSRISALNLRFSP